MWSASLTSSLKAMRIFTGKTRGRKKENKTIVASFKVVARYIILFVTLPVATFLRSEQKHHVLFRKDENILVEQRKETDLKRRRGVLLFPSFRTAQFDLLDQNVKKVRQNATFISQLFTLEFMNVTFSPTF